MEAIKTSFAARRREISTYLQMLEFIEQGGSMLGSSDRGPSFQIGVSTRHVLKASVFLHLYNLVESIVTACLKHVSREVVDSRLGYHQITRAWQQRWVSQKDELSNPQRRLTALLEMCDEVLSQAPLRVHPKFPIGNFDDRVIEKLLRDDYGIGLTLSPKLRTAINRHVVNRYGPIVHIRRRRNDLAHGLASFSDCGRDVSIVELRRWTAPVFWYLRAVMGQLDQHLRERQFMRSMPS